MTIQKRYVPVKDKDFAVFQGNLVDQVVTNAPGWGIPAPSVTALSARRAEFEPLFAIAEKKTIRRSADVLAYRECRKTYEKEIRAFAKAWLMFNPLVTDEQRREMALTVPDKNPTPRGKISGFPYIYLKAVGGGSIEVRAQLEKDATRPSMHPLADAVECRYTLVPKGEMPPDDPESMPKTQESKKALFSIHCGAKNAGESFWGFFRWVNLTRPDNSGDWSKALQVVIA